MEAEMGLLKDGQVSHIIATCTEKLKLELS